jgi:hypothetical protein
MINSSVNGLVTRVEFPALVVLTPVDFPLWLLSQRYAFQYSSLRYVKVTNAISWYECVGETERRCDVSLSNSEMF